MKSAAAPGGDDVQQIIHFLVSGTDCSSECFCGDVRNRYRKCLLRTGRLFCCKGRRRLDIRVRNFDDCFSLFRCFVFGYVERDDPCGFGIDVRYPTVVAFGRQGEFAEKYLHQGTKIAITGRIQTGSYTNKDGQRVYTTDVVVEEQEFAESKSSAANNGAAYTPSRPEPSAADEDGFMSIPDGDESEGLPFN